MNAYVFLGPSLPLDQAKSIVDATYLPPIQQGDLLRLLALKPRYVGIIDGYFETVPAVWHKEILLAMRDGVHVFGAASMGALRAAELHPFGMIGVGTIFQWFSDQTIVADDEVAVRHGPAELGYLPLNRSMVDIRDSCALALGEGIIDAPLADSIIDAAKTLPFWDRTCAAIAARLNSVQPPASPQLGAWLDFMASRYVSLKARDAAALLAAMKDHIAKPWRPHEVNFNYEHTIFIDRLLNDIALEKARNTLDWAPPAAREAQAMDELRRAALLRTVAREQAQRAGWELTRFEIAEKAGALWSAMGITDAEHARGWMERNGIAEQTLQSYISDEIYVARLTSAHRVEVERELALQLLMTQATQGGGAAGVSNSSSAAPST